VSERHQRRDSLIDAYHLARENLLDDSAADVGYERLKVDAANLDIALGALLDRDLADGADLERLDALRAELADQASRQIGVRPSDDGVEVQTDDSLGSEIVLTPWDQAVAVARRIIELARSRGDLR
jgi:hypothetical protein